MIQQQIKRFEIVFWDFDGVIKDSVDVKTEAYVRLFQVFGNEVAERVRTHHESNGGMSRFDKLPIYLSWAEQPTDLSVVEKYCDEFSSLVLQGVLDSPWVRGVKEYLLENCDQQYFVLVTATPQSEIEFIIEKLSIAHCFREVFGAPRNKSEAIELVLKNKQADPSSALMIGDAEADLSAAQSNNIPFLLRSTALNRGLLNKFDGAHFKDLAS